MKGEQNMPKGPCVVCGDTDYPLSMGGASICPSCDCGIPPEVKKLRRELKEAHIKIIKLEQQIQMDKI
jgi:hypothetical protein